MAYITVTPKNNDPIKWKILLSREMLVKSKNEIFSCKRDWN